MNRILTDDNPDLKIKILKMLREGWRQADIADEIGCSQVWVSKFSREEETKIALGSISSAAVNIAEKRVRDRLESSDGLYLLPCDDCSHFGNCYYYENCQNDMKRGDGLEYFKEK